MNKYKSIIVDSNNLYEKNYHVHKDLISKNKEGETFVTGGIYGFLISVNKIIRDFLAPEGTIYFLFDNHASKINMRKMIDPDYKKNRQRKEKVFYNGLQILQNIILHHSNNFKLVYRMEYEADDIVKPIILELPITEKILVISEDLDWARMINYEGRPIVWYAKKKKFNSWLFESTYGYKPTESNITLYKTFRGDKTDDIPIGVVDIRENILLELIQKYEDIYDLLKDLDNIPNLGIWKNRIKERESRLKLNFQLVSFIGIGKEMIKECIYDCTFRPSILKSLYKGLEFDIDSIDPRINQANNKPVYREEGFFRQIISK